MKSLIYITDTHFRTQNPISRTDNILEALLKKFEWCIEYAAKIDADVLHGGDLFHTPNVPDFVAHRIIKIIKKYKRQLYFVIGNHDVSGGNCNRYDYSKIGLMAEYPWFHLVGGKIKEFKDVILTGYDYSKEMDCPEYIDPLKDLKFETNGRPVICMIHSMLTDETPIQVDGKNKTINWGSVNANVDLILCGHYHPGWRGVRTHPFGTMFVNPGAMIRQTSAESDMKRKPRVVIIKASDGKLDVSFKTIPHDKKVFNHDMIVGKKVAEEEKMRFIEALNNLNSEEIAGNNILKILENINNMEMNDETKQLINPKVLAMCKQRIESLIENG